MTIPILVSIARARAAAHGKPWPPGCPVCDDPLGSEPEIVRLTTTIGDPVDYLALCCTWCAATVLFDVAMLELLASEHDRV